MNLPSGMYELDDSTDDTKQHITPDHPTTG